jgi:polar amino acid transport system substrate-binding protein
VRLGTRGRWVAPVVIAPVVMAVALVLAGCGGKTTESPNKQTSTQGVQRDDALAAMVPDKVKADGTLTIATDASYAPNEFKNGSAFQGMDIDLGTAIGKVLGLRVQFVNVQFDGILAGIASGRYEAGLSSFTDNKDREKTVDFVNYYRAGTSIAVRRGNPLGIRTTLDLCGRKVAAEQGTIQLLSLRQNKTAGGTLTLRGSCLQAGKPAPVPISQPDQNAVNSAMLAGRVDAFTADSPVVEYQIKVTNGGVEQGGQTTDVAPYGVALPKNDGDLAKAVQGAIQKLIDSGDYRKVLATWGVQAGAIDKATINAAGSP